MNKLVAVSGYNEDIFYINDVGGIINDPLWVNCVLLQTISRQTLEEGTWIYDKFMNKYTHSFSGLDVTPEVYDIVSKYKAKKAVDNLAETLTSNVITNSIGGKQSYIPYRYDLLDPYAMQCLTLVLAEGAANYEPPDYENSAHDENWRKISTRSHINHAMAHLINYLDSQDHNELTHAFCRLMFAIAQEGK